MDRVDHEGGLIGQNETKMFYAVTGHKGDENRKSIQCGRIQSEKGCGEGVKTEKTHSMGASKVRNKTYNTGLQQRPQGG